MIDGPASEKIMRKLSFIFLFSFLLLWLYNAERDLYLVPPFHHVTPIDISQKLKERSHQYQRTDLGALALSYNFGLNFELSKEQKALHQRLALKHLFSPSGLHVSYIFGVLFWLKRKKGERFHLGLCIVVGILGLFSLALPAYYPLKRTLLFSFLSLLISFKFRIKTWWIFLTTFTLDGFFGSYTEAPLSFTYSFLFWGIILVEKNFTRRFFYLFLAQMLVSFFQGTLFYPLSLLANILILPLFSLLFPFIFFGFFSAWINISEWSLDLFQQVLQWMDTWTQSISFIVTPPIILCILMFFILSVFDIRKYFILVLLLTPMVLQTTDHKREERNFFQRGFLRQKKGPNLSVPLILKGK